MLPTIWPGDVLVVARSAGGDLLQGEVAVFTNGTRLVAHRVITDARKPAYPRIQTQGDAVPVPDAPVSDLSLLGKVSVILRNGKSISPRRHLTAPERAIATLFRQSAIAARLAVRMHDIYLAARGYVSQFQNSTIQTLHVQTSTDRVVPCRP
jgi:hypothetical protein